MAVLAEALSVIVRLDAIDRVFTDGWAEFYTRFPLQTLCTDGQLVRLGFMDPQSVGVMVRKLQDRGLVFSRDGKCIDFEVEDQQNGPTGPCDWIEFAHLPFGDNGETIGACWLFEDQRTGEGVHMPGEEMDFAVPDGWQYEGSLSQKFTFVRNDDADKRLNFLRSEDGVDVFLDTLTGKEAFVGKPFKGGE